MPAAGSASSHAGLDQLWKFILSGWLPLVPVVTIPRARPGLDAGRLGQDEDGLKEHHAGKGILDLQQGCFLKKLDRYGS